MARARRAHIGRSREDTQRYLDTTVRRRQFEPTLADEEDDALLRASTETPAAELGRGETTGLTVRPTKQRSRAVQWLTDHWVEAIFIPIIGAVGFALLGAVYVQNRELGELRVRIDEAAIRVERAERSADEAEQRLRQEIASLQQRIDSLLAARSDAGAKK